MNPKARIARAIRRDGHTVGQPKLPKKSKLLNGTTRAAPVSFGSGLLSQKVVAVATDCDVVAVMQDWDTTAKDVPFCAWPRGSFLPPLMHRKVYMHPREAEDLGLMPRAN